MINKKLDGVSACRLVHRLYNDETSSSSRRYISLQIIIYILKRFSE